jgi:hypothetical protein
LYINDVETILIDGGYCFNNPSLMALADARKLNNNENKIYLLNVGTGDFIEKKNIITKKKIIFLLQNFLQIQF